jgi:hypothetical protein
MNGQRCDKAHPLQGPAALELLEAQVQSRLGGQVRGLRLVAAGQGLILRGRARSYYAKQLAQHAVMAATELRILANEIEVS